MSSHKAKNYCSVFGCLNNDSSNPGISYFTLPTEQKRRLEWLRVIDREDLTNKTKLCGRVCEIHFKTGDIVMNSQRKRLARCTIPSLHLPKYKDDKETQTDVTSVDSFIQINIPTCSFKTEIRSDNTPEKTSANTSANTFENTSENTSQNIIETTASLSADTPRKRKLEFDLSNLQKRLKLNEIEQMSGESQRDLFFKLCDQLLSSNLTDIVKAQVVLKSSHTGNRYTLAYKMFCLNLYYVSPQAYRLLQQTLCLPCESTLNKLNIPITTQVNDDLMAALKLKVNNMSDREKQCTLVVGATSLKANLFYNIKNDKIIGFHEVDGVQSPLAANYALVVLVRGIFVEWSQVIGFALLSENKTDDNISKWVDKIIVKLFEVGLKIKAFVSDLESDLLDAAKKRGISVEKTYFTVNDHKIYYIFDTPHLTKLVRNNLMTYDFHLQNGGVVKYEHIVKFYEDDKNKTYRQAYKLTNSHINPKKMEKLNVEYATQLLSRSVAAGLSTYIDFKIIDESATQTADFIKNMNDLFDALNSSTYRHSYAYKSAFCGNTDQIDFLNSMLKLFHRLMLFNPKNCTYVTKTGQFVDGFQITIKSVLQLYDDLKREGFKYLFTRRLNQDVIKKFFKKIRSKSGTTTEPTSTQFISAYTKIYITNITQAPKEGNRSEDFSEFLSDLKNYQHFEIGAKEIDEHPTSSSDNNQTQRNVLCEISRSDYALIELPEKGSFLHVCGALLKKCVDYHRDCELLKAYVGVHQSSGNLNVNVGSNADQNLVMVPPDDFVINIKRMEQVFCKAFEKDHIDTTIGTSIYEQLQDTEFTMPCPCFPKSFLLKLYVRMRIYYTLTVNNKAFRICRKRTKVFSVPNF